MIFLPQHDYPVGMIPDECGECATNSGCRAKCTPSGKSLCVQAVKPLYGWSFLFACGVNGGASRMYLDRFYPSRRARRSICHPLSTKTGGPLHREQSAGPPVLIRAPHQQSGSPSPPRLEAPFAPLGLPQSLRQCDDSVSDSAQVLVEKDRFSFELPRHCRVA